MFMKNRYLLRRAIAECVASSPVCDFHGTKDELTALVDAIASTKIFESKLMNDSSTLAEITKALKRKHACARRFEHLYGMRWAL
jgi:hypothetical protein